MRPFRTTAVLLLALIATTAFSQIPKRIVDRQFISSDTVIAGGTDVKQALDTLSGLVSVSDRIDSVIAAYLAAHPLVAYDTTAGLFYIKDQLGRRIAYSDTLLAWFVTRATANALLSLKASRADTATWLPSWASILLQHYLGPLDSVRIRAYSNALYLNLADSTRIRNYSNLLYALASHSHSGSAITSGTVGAAYLPLNSSTSAGIVSSGAGQAWMVWKTDASGNGGWRRDSVGAGTGGGSATYASSLAGTGVEIYKNKTDSTLHYKRVKAGNRFATVIDKTDSVEFAVDSTQMLQAVYDTAAFSGTNLRVAVYVPGATSSDVFWVTWRSPDGTTIPTDDGAPYVYVKTDSVIVIRPTGSTSGLSLNYGSAKQ